MLKQGFLHLLIQKGLQNKHKIITVIHKNIYKQLTVIDYNPIDYSSSLNISISKVRKKLIKFKQKTHWT